MGGLWGMKKAAGICMRDEYANYVEDTSRGFRNAHDQNFLADVIYNRVLPTLLIHYSKAPVFEGEKHTVKFPFAWSNDFYCGRIEKDFVDREQPPMKQTLFTLPTASMRMEKPTLVASSPPQPPPASFIPRPPDQPTLFLTRK